MNNKQAKKLRKAAMAVSFVQQNANPKVVYKEFKEICWETIIKLKESIFNYISMSLYTN